MKRRLFNIVSGLSLLLCVATAVLWVHSYNHPLLRRFTFFPNATYPLLERGNMSLGSERNAIVLTVREASSDIIVGGRPVYHLRRVAYIPYLFILLSTACLPGIWLIRKFACRRRVTKGLCPICGYDLRATPDRCPECGPSQMS